MADILSLKESVLVYLDISGGLQKLTEDCKQFDGRPAAWRNKTLLAIAANMANFTIVANFPDSLQAEAVYRFCVTVNPSDVIEVDPLLGDCILRDPLKATWLFQSVSIAVS